MFGFAVVECIKPARMVFLYIATVSCVCLCNGTTFAIMSDDSRLCTSLVYILVPRLLITNLRHIVTEILRIYNIIILHTRFHGKCKKQ